MKALQITKYGEIKSSLSFNDIDKPKAGPTDILVEVKAAALNPIDYKLIEGHLKEIITLEFPCTIGYDVSGIIKEVGEKVERFKIGDEIYARVPQEQMGTVAEYVVVTTEVVSKKPENITFEESAGLPLTGLTAIQALESVGIKQNDRVLIHAGSGGVGSFAVQYAKAKGAYVFTTASTDNVDMVKSFGADRVIDYKKEDYKKIATDLDIVLDTLGDDYTFEAFALITKGGKVSTLVGPPDEETAKQMGMKGYKLPERLEKLIKEKSAVYKLTWMNPNGKQLEAIKSMVENGDIKPEVDNVYPLEKAIEAYEYIATGHAKGKVIVKIS
ncbi:hypothetical protein SAMN03097699_0314 [Flavobacteriaceae bacterium MAR_2010_188]|nr:hypothetical protein SAMN03097699_0314 [Flavobacteriaceae bacterium MAR_2010_188]